MRTLIAAVCGIITAFGLFWGMQALVSVSGELREPGMRLSVDFVRLRRDRAPEAKKREPPKREKPEAQPAPPEMNLARNMNPGDATADIGAMMDTSAQLEEATSLGVGGGDRQAVPLVQVDPEYPPRAMQLRLEGWVEVEFTITKVGTVKDVKVIGSRPAMIFDRAAVDAVRRWRYNAKIEKGEAVEQPGQMLRFDFNLPRGSR